MDEYISREAVLKRLNECKEDPLFDPDMARICFAIGIFIENMKAADVQPVNQWISVNDRLPDEVEAEVLVWIEDGTADDIKIYNSLHIAYWYGDTKLFYDFHCEEIKGVTHWMYTSAISEPPKDGDAE